MYNSIKIFVKSLSKNSSLSLGIGLSGGADSVALAHLLYRLQQEKVILKLTAVHFNHHLRGVESEGDNKFVINFCKKFDIELISNDLDVTEFCRTEGVAMEEGARILRYEKIRAIIKQRRIDYFALGHHRDDRVETVLFNIFRGSGLTGLAAMKKNKGSYIRPLLNFSKDDILSYIQANNLKYREDSSNKESKVDRNKLRNIIIPDIEKLLHRKIRGNVINLAQICDEVNDFTDNYLEQLLDDYNLVRSFRQFCFINRAKFNEQQIYIKRQIVNKLLQQMGFTYNINFKKSNLIIDFLSSDSHETISFHGFSFSVYQNNIIIGKDKLEITEAEIKNQELTTYNGLFSVLQIGIMENDKIICFADSDKICGKLKIVALDKKAVFYPFGR